MSTPQIREKLDKIEISYNNEGRRKVRCFCGKTANASIVAHIKRDHPQEWEDWGIDFVKLRNEGLSSYSIILKFKTKDDRFLFTSSVVQREIQRLLEEKKANLLVSRKKKIEEWHPKSEDQTRGTLWTFKSRGSWAVHRGDYRGNWPPEVPRALIGHYSEENDIVIDPFVGGGTTLIEAWLTNRRSIGLDISPVAIATTNARIQEMADQASGDPRVSLEKDLRPAVLEGDARQLGNIAHKLGIQDGSVSLVCAHPPYLNSLRYTAAKDGDLSHLSNPAEFCDQLQLIAKQILNLLKEEGVCAVLIGDVRKSRHIIPLGFLTMERFLKEGFKLKEIIIKAQNRDSSTRFWYTQRDKLDFLIDHEYLFVFTKQI